MLTCTALHHTCIIYSVPLLHFLPVLWVTACFCCHPPVCMHACCFSFIFLHLSCDPLHHAGQLLTLLMSFRPVSRAQQEMSLPSSEQFRLSARECPWTGGMVLCWLPVFSRNPPPWPHANTVITNHLRNSAIYAIVSTRMSLALSKTCVACAFPTPHEEECCHV